MKWIYDNLLNYKFPVNQVITSGHRWFNIYKHIEYVYDSSPIDMSTEIVHPR